MSYTPNLGLYLTSEDDKITKFKEWRVAMNGEGIDSNMEIIDTIINSLQTNKADSGVVTSDTIDNKLEAGIYDCGEGIDVSYSLESRADQVGTCRIITLIVSRHETQKYSKQLGVGMSGSKSSRILVYRIKSGTSSWSSWDRIDEDLASAIGTLSELQTTSKTDLVSAINEKADYVTNNGFAAGSEYAAGNYCVTIGDGAETNDYSVAIGTRADANFKDNVAIGNQARASTEGSTAIGAYSFAGDQGQEEKNYINSTVLGYSASAKDKQATAIGANAEAGFNGVAIGYGAVADSDAVQIGSGINPNDDTLQFQNYKIVNYDGDEQYLNDVGKLTNLATKDKSDIVAAINELNENKADFKNTSDGFNAGDQSEASDGGGAIGRLAKTTSGGAVGSEAESKNGFAGGYHVKVGGMGAAIGANASAYHGGAVGSGAQAGNGFAGGINAQCGKALNGADVDCIQLGTGTNGNEKTLKVYDYQLTTLDAQGKQHLLDVGDISKLKTDDKTDIVAAINSLQTNKADRGVVTDKTIDTLFEPGIYTIDPTSVIYVGKSAPHNDAEPYVLLVAKRPDNVTYQIAFCWGSQSSDGTMDNDEGDYDCILWRIYSAVNKEWNDWRQLTSGGSGNNNYAAKGTVTADTIDKTLDPGIYGIDPMADITGDTDNGERMLLVANTDLFTYQCLFADTVVSNSDQDDVSHVPDIYTRSCRTSSAKWSNWTLMNANIRQRLDILESQSELINNTIKTIDTKANQTDIGNLSKLKTTDKTNLVNAINENFENHVPYILLEKDVTLQTLDKVSLNIYNQFGCEYGVAAGFFSNPVTLPGYGSVQECDFILKSYLFAVFSGENKAMQELYMNGVILRRTMNESGEWNDFVDVTGGDGSVTALQAEIATLKAEIQDLKANKAYQSHTEADKKEA